MSPLRKWRGSRSLEDVADLLRISPPTLSRVERGETWVGRALAKRLRALTGLSLDELLIDPTKDTAA